MEVGKVLHMNGGTGKASYANNSLLQQKVINLTKGMREEAIGSIFLGTLPRRLAIADLGCSSGPNTFLVVSEAIKLVEKYCEELKHESPEYHVFMNDLPGNDFNNIFKSIACFKEKLSNEIEAEMGPCYITGVPGSFYDRIFPIRSLDFVHSSYSLHWLSQVPEGIENNKGNIYMAKTSPINVLDAYYAQFQRDFSSFLKCRAQELVEGGSMVLTILGRRHDDPSSKECSYIWDLLASALNDMISEGLIKEAQMDRFNIPIYSPSASEVKSEVMKEGSFSINRVEVSEVHWNAYNNMKSNSFDGGYNVTNTMRAVMESLLVSHFGEALIDEIFDRYRNYITDAMAKEDKTELVNVSISMTRRA